jgi:hypothetical protein
MLLRRRNPSWLPTGKTAAAMDLGGPGGGLVAGETMSDLTSAAATGVTWGPFSAAMAVCP